MNNIEILEEFIEKNIKSRLRTELNANELQAIENLIKENKELKNKCNELNFKYTAQWVDDNFIPKSKVKEKMQKDIKINEHVILGGRRNGKTLEYGKRLGRIEMCEELLEEEGE